MNQNKFLCIHGHFYQPPRENAWTNEIDQQPSAAPFHDWNERIYQECYKPNSAAVIVDRFDKVIQRINNYEFFNFDFGPNLLAWINKIHPKTYGRIIEADKKSFEVHNGHGNAIAMVYNHIIMPLANRNDKVTQVKWGVADFRFHFGRDPEGIWLPETACNEETLEVLVEEKIKYIILDQPQASKIKRIFRGKWSDVSGGNIETGCPYRCFVNNNSEKFIDIFFYNGALSRNIAFDEHIYDSAKLLLRIEQVKASGTQNNLISVAVDGETFGHHKRFTERTMSYLFSELAPNSGYKFVNFGEYLSSHIPKYEVKLKDGDNNEGTSWSCTHGTGRWKEDCGCGRTTENPSQEWRSVLRDTLNWLRDELIIIYENVGRNLFKNPWTARNEYIKVLLNPDKESWEKFFYFNARKFLDKNENNLCTRLLEMQKFAMLMFTSCGWFFSDISGIETIQILQYAARAIELAREITGFDFEEDFLEKLSAARSNSSEYKDGKDLYIKKVKTNLAGNIKLYY